MKKREKGGGGGGPRGGPGGAGGGGGSGGAESERTIFVKNPLATPRGERRGTLLKNEGVPRGSFCFS